MGEVGVEGLAYSQHDPIHAPNILGVPAPPVCRIWPLLLKEWEMECQMFDHILRHPPPSNLYGYSTIKKVKLPWLL